MKKFIFSICVLKLCIFGAFSTANAQTFMKKDVKLSKGLSKKEPIITSPLPGSEISGPFVLVGKAEPNAMVTIKVTPKNGYISNGTGKPRFVQSGATYKEQVFTVQANVKGLWQSEVIEVSFNTGATDKKILVFTSQDYDGGTSTGKTVEYKTPGMIMVMAPATFKKALDITWPVAGSIVKQDTRIAGTAKPGAVVKVMVHSGYYPQGGGSPRAGEKQQLYATAGTDGKWQTEMANFSIITQPYSNSNYDIVATVENSSESKKINVIHPNETTVATSAFRVTSHGATTMIPNGTFKIKGVARPGAKILVERRYNGTSTYKNKGGVILSPTRVEITKKTDADLGSLSATADQNGEWWVSCNMQKLTRHDANNSATTTVQATSMVVKACLVDDNGNKLKTETLMFFWSLK